MQFNLCSFLFKLNMLDKQDLLNTLVFLFIALQCTHEILWWFIIFVVVIISKMKIFIALQ